MSGLDVVTLLYYISSIAHFHGIMGHMTMMSELLEYIDALHNTLEVQRKVVHTAVEGYEQAKDTIEDKEIEIEGFRETAERVNSRVAELETALSAIRSA